MFRIIANHWWLTILRGAFAVLLGLAAFFLPGATLGALALLFGAYVLADGAVAIGTSLSNQYGRWWLLFLEGVIGILAGLATLIWPAITAVVLVYLIAGWAVATGVLEMLTAIQLRREISNEWSLGLSGLASIIFGVLIFAWPSTGALALLWLLGAYALLFGGLLIYLGIRLRDLDAQQREGIDGKSLIISN